MRSRTVLLAVGTAVSLRAGEAAAQCRGPDSMASRMVAKYSGLMRRAPTDSVLNATIAEIGLRQVDPASVVLVTDTAVCARAEQAYRAALRGTLPPSGSVYVVKVGTAGYAVRDPAQRGGDWYVEMILDEAFNVKYSYMASLPEPLGGRGEPASRLAARGAGARGLHRLAQSLDLL